MSLLNLNRSGDAILYPESVKNTPFGQLKSSKNIFCDISNRIIDDFNPSSVLDVGSPNSYLVETFLSLGIEAHNLDISDFQCSSLSELSINKRFDLVICLSMLENFQPNQIEQSIRILCSLGDIVLVTSESIDLSNSDNLDFQSGANWDEKFEKSGFVRILDYDASYIAPWTQVFRRVQMQEEDFALELAEIIESNSKLPIVSDEVRGESEYLLRTESENRKHENLRDWLIQKKTRLKSLYSTASFLLEKGDFSGLAKQGYLFLKGERRNLKTAPSVDSFKTDEFAKMYGRWIKKNEPQQPALNEQRSSELNFSYRPPISILTSVNNPETKKFEKMIESVIAQTYSNWELHLVETYSGSSEIHRILEKYSKKDSRIKVCFLAADRETPKTLNELLKLIHGEFMALLNQSDELAPNALFENVLLLNHNSDADMIYSDEDSINRRGKRSNAIFKPDWSPDFFYSTNYTGHFAVYRKMLIENFVDSGFRFDGLESYELVLRLIEQTDRIYHIPKVLYHSCKKVAANDLNKKVNQVAKIKSFSEHFKRQQIEVEVLPGLADNLLRVKRKLQSQPKVSIIIPTRDKAEMLETCLNSIRSKTTYPNYEIIIVNNKSTEPQTLAYLELLSREENISVIDYNHQFNFSAINNLASKKATGELLLFLNNDVEVVSSEWLEAMVEQAIRPEVGAVGSRLLYPDGRIQHAGVIIGIGGLAGHSHKYLSEKCSGYLGRTKAIQNFSAVTAACMMVRADVFASLGGFDEKHLTVSYNDIDFCLRLRQKNFLIVYTPYAELYHYESISRDSDQLPRNAKRSKREREYMLRYWKDELKFDPYYNPNLTLEKEDFSLAFVNRKMDTNPIL